MVTANIDTMLCAKKFTPKMVEIHEGSSDISQSKAANVVVSAKKIIATGATRCELTVSAGSPDASCLVELPNSLREISTQERK